MVVRSLGLEGVGGVNEGWLGVVSVSREGVLSGPILTHYTLDKINIDSPIP